ncbi:PREDICTED: transmembrane protein 105 [Cercocebus atys]|nr:PREDICTED: transmembrane protein 105 [Cercocebus atys]
MRQRPRLAFPGHPSAGGVAGGGVTLEGVQPVHIGSASLSPHPHGLAWLSPTLLKVRRASLKALAAPHQGAFRAGNVIGQLIYLLTWSLFTAWLRPLTLLQGPRMSPQGSPPRPPWGDYAEPSCLCEMKIRRRHEGPAWGQSGFLAEGLHLAPSSLSPAACGVVRMKGLWGRGAGIRRR